VTDTYRTFGSRFQLTGDPFEATLYDEHVARDHERGVDVGLCVPRDALFPDAASRRRLAHAATAVRAVIEPRLRRVFAVGDLPSAWIASQPATRLPPGTAPPIPELVRRVDAVGGALTALHGAGLVHGGVLDDDVVVVDGEIRLGGGGVWACADPEVLARRADWVVPPERRRGAPATAVSDVYAFAALIARWVGGAGPPELATAPHHPELHAALEPFLVEDQALRATELGALIARARSALALPYLRDRAPAAPVVAAAAQARGRRKRVADEDRTRVGHASGRHERDGGPEADLERTTKFVRDGDSIDTADDPVNATVDAAGAVPAPPPRPVIPPAAATRHAHEHEHDHAHAPVPVPPLAAPALVPAPALIPAPPIPSALAEIASAPIVALSMKPAAGIGPPAVIDPPTPQLQRPVIREPRAHAPRQSLGRLAPPRAVVEAARRRTRRTWLWAVVGVLAIAVIVLAILVAI
jgi:hypothetical protein